MQHSSLEQPLINQKDVSLTVTISETQRKMLADLLKSLNETITRSAITRGTPSRLLCGLIVAAVGLALSIYFLASSTKRYDNVLDDLKHTDSGTRSSCADVFVKIDRFCSDLDKDPFKICTALCELLGTAEMTRLFSIGGISVASTLVLILATTLIWNCVKTPSSSAEALQACSINQCERGIVEKARGVFAECKGLPGFERLSMESPVGKVKEAIRLTLLSPPAVGDAARLSTPLGTEAKTARP